MESRPESRALAGVAAEFGTSAGTEPFNSSLAYKSRANRHTRESGSPSRGKQFPVAWDGGLLVKERWIPAFAGFVSVR